jgi:hypothetical protein
MDLNREKQLGKDRIGRKRKKFKSYTNGPLLTKNSLTSDFLALGWCESHTHSVETVLEFGVLTVSQASGMWSDAFSRWWAGMWSYSSQSAPTIIGKQALQCNVLLSCDVLKLRHIKCIFDLHSQFTMGFLRCEPITGLGPFVMDFHL